MVPLVYQTSLNEVQNIFNETWILFRNKYSDNKSLYYKVILDQKNILHYSGKNTELYVKVAIKITPGFGFEDDVFIQSFLSYWAWWTHVANSHCPVVM